MQLTVFSTDDKKSGFRLHYMEVYNWGTFDDVVHRIQPLGETSLLTGANGSGKTTFVDALLTLIVPEKKYRFYNQSSGSERKGDRTEESYVLGGFGTMNSEATGALQTQYLRESKEQAYSILLAHFANEAEQGVTLFQVRYFVNGEMKKVYGIAHKALHIEEDFKPFDLSGNWKRALDHRYNKSGRKVVDWFEAASKYAQQLVHVLGMQSAQALQLFNQTVGIKVLGNLDEFIRTHMLEPRQMEETFLDLKKQLHTLLEAQRNIEKTEEQIKLLLPIKEHYESYVTLQKAIEDSQQQLDIASIWRVFTKNELLALAIEERESACEEMQRKLEETKEALEQLREEERITKNLIDQNQAGQRLQQLEARVQELEKEKKKAETNLTLFTSWCTELHLKETAPEDDSAYHRILKDVGRKNLELATKQRINEDEDYEAKRLKERSTEKKEEIEDELKSLLQHKNNIDGRLLAIRRQVCEALRIDSQELPFAGELMQVRPEELSWQPALEKLLRPFSLRLLVPEKHYKKVNKYVNQTDLRGRLVYELVTETVVFQEPQEGSVYEKLEFHPEHALRRWVEHHVIRQFDYACLEDEKNIDRYERGITLNGLIKNRFRHEKDDRPEKNGPDQYVMGWNNERKKAYLVESRNKHVAAIQQAEEQIKSCRARRERLGKQFVAVSHLQNHAGFDSIDVARIERSVHELQGQISSLRKGNKELDALKEQLSVILGRTEEAGRLHEQYVGKDVLLRKELEKLREEKDSLAPVLAPITEADKTTLLQFQFQHAQLLSAVTYETIEPLYEELKQEKTKLLQEQRDGLHKEETVLNKCINRIKNPSSELKARFSPEWEGDVQLFAEDARYANEYIEWLDKLQKENLPHYRKKFENYINETITYKIGGLNEELEKWVKDISYSIQKLNQSLGGINFNRNPDTYIQLNKRALPAGTEIKEFQGRLLDALPQAADWQQSSFEEKSLHFKEKVQPLINELDKNEHYRSRVMDVRNWFEFWADEIYRNTNEIKKTYRQMGQLSGGEKAQLTYTILCSAIAYQFGITKEGKNSRSLRFIAIDESFSNQDEDKANYLMELCKQLHLQLLVVTPSDKIQIVQDFIAHVHLVQRVNNRHSVLYNMTIKELKEKLDESLN